MVISRRMANGELNPYEPHQAQIYTTSAGSKATYAYNKMIELLEDSIINPKKTFCWGCSYEVPVMFGLLDDEYLNEIRSSPTYKDESFAKEFLSIWVGGSEDSWLSYDKLTSYRKLKKAEWSWKIRAGDKSFYLLSVDVGRLKCQTIVSVFKVFQKPTGLYASLVNIIELGRTPERKHFELQALDLKKIIQAFSPREVVIDGNGSTRPLHLVISGCKAFELLEAF